MAWDSEKIKYISELFNKRMLGEFIYELTRHPEYRRHEDGADLWLWQSAMDGKLNFIKALIDLGLGVNDSKDLPQPENPLCTVEGPIVDAAANGHLEVVRWLLDHGAQINFVVQGKTRCLPITYAASQGHLEVVKLLVERGGDYKATWNGVNAITQAAMFGHTEVRDYLRGLGAKDLRELNPPDYPAAHKRWLKKMAVFGPVDDWSLEIPGTPPVTLHVARRDPEGKSKTLFTVGLSDHPLPAPSDDFPCTELIMVLPADWPLTASALGDPQQNWPIEWFKRIVDQMRGCDHWLETPSLFMNGTPPAPLAAETGLCGWLYLQVPEGSEQMRDYRFISMHSLTPIYAEEEQLIKEQGLETFLNRLIEREIPTYLDPHRPNVGTA